MKEVLIVAFAGLLLSAGTAFAQGQTASCPPELAARIDNSLQISTNDVIDFVERNPDGSLTGNVIEAKSDGSCRLLHLKAAPADLEEAYAAVAEIRAKADTADTRIERAEQAAAAAQKAAEAAEARATQAERQVQVAQANVPPAPETETVCTGGSYAGWTPQTCEQRPKRSTLGKLLGAAKVSGSIVASIGDRSHVRVVFGRPYGW